VDHSAKKKVKALLDGCMSAQLAVEGERKGRGCWRGRESLIAGTFEEKLGGG